VTDDATPAPEAGAAPSYATTGPDAIGVPAVDAILQRLGALDERPASEHVAAYESIHADLQDLLADAADRSDEGPAHPDGAR
jgi:hypothetical protein